ncbi:MAG TPA: hypothetical protein VI299_27130 [Polyangiales bacterium]
MLTVTLMLSGPHRTAMLETAFDSIPIDSDAVSEVIVRHQGGPWQWGGALRERILSTPKVRLLEFADRVDWAHSYNRTLDAVRTPWALLLPDDDFLVRSVAKRAFERALVEAGDCGLIAFGWHFLQRGRYLASTDYRPALPALIHHTPKFCATLINVRHARRLGGFSSVGGFVDTELFGRLVYEHDAAIVNTHAAVYRLHEGQESNRLDSVYGPHVEHLLDTLGRYAKNEAERAAFERQLRGFVYPRDSELKKRLRALAYTLRSRPRPARESSRFRMQKWSSA